MNVLLVGSSGSLGTAIYNHLSTKHTIITANRKSGDIKIDITNVQSIKQAFEQAGNIDAVICAAGEVSFNTLTELNQQDWQIGLQSKLMGQILLASEAAKNLPEQGSITLTSGILTNHPIAYGLSASTINGGVEHFVKASALEMPKQIRINAVSPTVLESSWGKFGDYFTGFEPVSDTSVAKAYERALTGILNGRIIEANA